MRCNYPCCNANGISSVRTLSKYLASQSKMFENRDPSLYPNVTVFQGEMRRRVWYSILTLDSVSSFMVGLPSMIRAVDHDTAEPRNIHDWELYDGISELPASRPWTEVTPVSYLIAKARLLRPLGAVMDFVSSLQHDSYEKALQIDEQLSTAYHQMPSHIRIRDIERTARYSPATVNRMVQVELLFHHGVCVLHRQFLVRSRHGTQFARSREQCINSAIAILNQQSILYEVGKATDSVNAVYWFRVSPISQVFALPAVILCLDLRYRKESTDGNYTKSSDEVHENKAVLEALRTAYNIWKEAQNLSPDSQKVFRVLSQLFENLGIDTQDDCVNSQKSELPASIPDQSAATHSDQFALEQNTSPSIDEMDIDWVSLRTLYPCIQN